MPPRSIMLFHAKLPMLSDMLTWGTHNKGFWRNDKEQCSVTVKSTNVKICPHKRTH